MPRLDPTGDYLAAGLAGPVSIKHIDGVVEIVCGRGSYAQWLDPRTIIFQALDGASPTIDTWDLFDIGRTRRRTLSPVGCNELAAGGGLDGRWVAWRAPMPGDPGGLFGSLGERRLAGNAPPEADGRGTVARDGTIAIVEDRQNGGPLQLHSRTGVVFELPGVAPYGMRVLDFARATWNGGALGVDASGRLPGAAWGVYLEAPDGKWWVDQTPRGLVAYRTGETVGHLITAGASFHHDAVVAADGRVVVGYSTGIGEMPPESVIVRDARTLPVINLLEVTLPEVRRAAWFGWFRFGAGNGPGNVVLDVWGDGLIVRTDRQDIVASYTAAEEAGSTPAALAAAIAGNRKRWPTVPVVAYWPRRVQDGAVPDADYVGVEAYFPKTVSLADREAEIRRSVSRCRRVALIPQVYTSNDSNVSDLQALVPIYARIWRDCPQVEMILAFADGAGRATGLPDHPEVRPLWDRMWASVTGPAPYVVVGTTPTDPTDPVDPPDPTDPTDPVDPQHPGEDMPPTLKVIPPTFDEWIKHEFPQVRDAYIKKQGHSPNDEWAAFQTQRRFHYWIGDINGDGKWVFGEWWPLERMLANERGEDASQERFPQP